MEIALIGLPNSGKTTVYNVLTGANEEPTAFSGGKFEPHCHILKVPDSRIDALTEMYDPKKTIYATIQVTDIPGIKRGDMKNEKFATQVGAYVGQVDSLVHVVQAFGEYDVETAVTELEFEFIMQDLERVENRLEKLEKQIKRIAGNERKKLEIEKNALLRAQETLQNEMPLRTITFTEDEMKPLKSFQFLSLKPLMILLNCDEESIHADFDFGEGEKYISLPNTKVARLCGQLEMEISQMDAQEAAEFMEMYQLKEPAKNSLIRELYNLLNQIAFFTVGPDEVRAWPILDGMNAQLAAGAIHSDIQQGFIRAEVMKYSVLLELGSEAAVKKDGQYRAEGKEYIVEDGDIIQFLHNK